MCGEERCDDIIGLNIYVNHPNRLIMYVYMNI